MSQEPEKPSDAQICRADTRDLREGAAALDRAASAAGRPLDSEGRKDIVTAQTVVQGHISRLQQDPGSKEALPMLAAIDNELAAALTKGKFKPSRDVAAGLREFASEMDGAASEVESACTTSLRNNRLKEERSGGRA
jgi:hypothetical protein